MLRDTLLFDLDGTLVDSAHDITAALNCVRAERGGDPITIAEVRPLVALGAATLVERGLGKVAREMDTDLGAFRSHLRRIPADRAAIYPGVRTALATLRRDDYRMIVVTNKPEGLARKLLEELDLAPSFAGIVGGDTTPHAKPAPEPILHALGMVAAGPERALLIGDSHIDAKSARALAIPFLLFTGGYGASDCADEDVQARFDDFAALPRIVGLEGKSI